MADDRVPPPSTATASPAATPLEQIDIDGGRDLNPLEGGRWRPVRPEELLRRPPPATEETNADGGEEPKVKLERRQELEHRLRISPSDRDAFLELGRIYLSENRPLEAGRILKQAREIFPEDAEILWTHEESVLARSLQQYRQVSELAHRLTTPETERELERSRSDWARRRIDICRARLKRDPSLARLRVILAEALYDAGQYEEAIEELRMVLDDDDLSSQAYLQIGRSLIAMGRDAEAMPHFRAAALRRSVAAPARIRLAALRLLVDTAQRIGVPLTLERYRKRLQEAEQAK